MKGSNLTLLHAGVEKSKAFVKVEINVFCPYFK